MERTNSLSIRYIKVREDRQGISMINVIMTRQTIRIGFRSDSRDR